MPNVSTKDEDDPPDAFVSHSSRDKNLFVRPLVECLTDQGASVWYDEYSLLPGDSLSKSIDLGLSRARHGLVIISPSFIKTAEESGWTSYELRGIVSNSIGPEGRRVLPVWLDVGREEVRRFSPPLADLLAINATNLPIEQVALDILKVIAPERSDGLRRLRFVLRPQDPSRVENVDPRILKPSPPVRRRVGGHVALRALLVTQALQPSGHAFASDLDGFLEDLARDLHHEKELRVWEAIAASFSFASTNFLLDESGKKSAFELLLSATFGRVSDESIDALGQQVADAILDHFQTCMAFAKNEILIGEAGLIGLIKENSDDPPSPSDSDTSS